jgi:hypothetical protein
MKGNIIENKSFTKSQRRKIKKDIALKQKKLDWEKKKRKYRKDRQFTKKNQHNPENREYRKSRDRKVLNNKIRDRKSISL